ncbi:MAG TPA: helix-turn-helix domain-containing protein [Candidatus Saccharimonadales bacterium]|nr:helix-turn-helix domain-containing protein [Candidatus Saccharimonadales bacterium]
MIQDHEAAVRTAVDDLVAALLAAVRAEATPASAAPDRLLSIDEAASALGIGRSRLYDEIGAGRLRSIRVGRRRLVAAGSIADFIAATPAIETPGAAASREGSYYARRSTV